MADKPSSGMRVVWVFGIGGDAPPWRGPEMLEESTPSGKVYEDESDG